jgi:hypothetical protein
MNMLEHPLGFWATVFRSILVYLLGIVQPIKLPGRISQVNYMIPYQIIQILVNLKPALIPLHVFLLCICTGAAGYVAIEVSSGLEAILVHTLNDQLEIGYNLLLGSYSAIVPLLHILFLASDIGMLY